MNERHRDILRRHWPALRRDLEPVKLLPYLVNVLDVTDEQEVKVKATREERTDKLLEILPRRGPTAFDDFVTALQEVQPFLATPLVKEAEMEEMKTELNRARTHSARLREEVCLIRTSLENEQQKHKKTQKELKELKSIHETLMVKSKDDQRILQAKGMELENKIKSLEEELSAKEVFVGETERLRTMCNKLDDDLRNLKENFEKTSKENKELTKKLSDYQNITLNQSNSSEMTTWTSMQVGHNIFNRHSPNFHFIENEDEEMKPAFCRNDAISVELLDKTRKDIAKVTKEREDLKQKCEELEKQLQDTFTSLERTRSGSFHDRATSPGEPIQSDFEGDNPCSRCDTLEEECTLLRTERDFIKGMKVKLEEEIKELNIDIQDLRAEHAKEKQILQRELQGLREEHEKLSRDFEKELQKMLREVIEQQIARMKNLQGQNEELNELLKKQKSEVQKVSTQLKKEKSHLEKIEDEFVKVKKNLAREKKKLKETKEVMEAETKGKTDALRELAKLKVELSEKEKQKGEEIARLRKDFLDRCKCEALKEEIARLRNMPGRKYAKFGVLNYRKDFDRHGLIYALGTNFGTSSWVNPSSTNSFPTRIIATRSSDEQGSASDLLDTRRGGTLSGTKDEERSWWSVDLSEKYALYLTHYTLRQGRDNGMSIIRNWRLEGSLDGRTWKLLRKHENDRGLKEPYPYYTATWCVDGELGAFRYFRIFQTAKNSSGRHNISSVDSATLKQVYAGLVTMILEAIKMDCDSSSLSSVLEDCKWGTDRIEYFTKQFLDYKPNLEALLARTGSSFPHVVDVDWRLDYYIKNNQMEKVNKPTYLITLKTEEAGKAKGEDVQFSCTMEQLQDLVGKLKDACKSVEKASNN
ncbi:myosin-9-like isoform X2 [Stylophora pistillata]|uniref:myosin-9-like isoform X2 n=1 Tax=Stylophora pistillata TaxID=50429 RepID=UPI000C04AFAC|nr:myosin-9-like isoform X2 [Stylophora pistillata]